MKIVSIEPTPNPNSMKLNVDQSLPDRVSLRFAREAAAEAPPHLRGLLEIDGVAGVYQVADFLALDRKPGASWAAILAQARQVLEGAAADEGSGGAALATIGPGSVFGGVQVLVQMFRGIPMQVKLLTGTEDVRFGLPDRIARAAFRAAKASANVILERKWEDKGLRYGDVQEIGREMVEQIDAAYPDDRLQRLLEQALAAEPGEAAPSDVLSPEQVLTQLGEPDWRRRYAALDRMEPSETAIPVLERALSDPHPSVRRLAVVYVGELKEANVLPLLLRALRDSSAAVRRAAGDCLSDRGDPAAIPAVAEALRDPNKLVRWRAARYLYEVGDESALPALRAAVDDPEFEIALQVRLAIERIEGGHGAVEPVWQQMTRRLSEQE